VRRYELTLGLELLGRGIKEVFMISRFKERRDAGRKLAQKLTHAKRLSRW
jgi:hypothetical protein